MGTETGCALCDLPLGESAVTGESGAAFCCTGCRRVHETLAERDDLPAPMDDGPNGGADVGAGLEADGEGDGVPPDPDVLRGATDGAEATEPHGADGRSSAAPSTDHETTFLHVDGMHCATCELFIESVAADRIGVASVDASYVTDTVRIEHDPAVVGADDLIDRLSGHGYDASPRADARSRERADELAAIRIAVGALFGMMVMLLYVTIIYPTYFGGLFYGEQGAAYFAHSMASPSGNYFFFVLAAMTGVVLLVTGGPILRGAYVSLRVRSPNMDLLVALAAVSAYAYSTLSIVAGGTHVYYDVTVAIVLVVAVGGFHESRIKRAAVERLSDLTAARADTARRYTGVGATEPVDVEALAGGDRLLVRAGERVPVDGTVVDGEATVDEAVVTGEPLPIAKTRGDAVVGGSIVTDGALDVTVAEGARSSVDRIRTLVWDLQSTNHGVQALADRLATIFVPAVAALAIAVTAWNLWAGTGISGALLVGLTVLIVSCPCALGLATPLGVAAGIRDGLERGVVVFDDTVFERLRGVDVVIFDKTGTLTTGDMAVVDADAPPDLLALAGELERRSSHPIAGAIADAFGAAAGESPPNGPGGPGENAGGSTATDGGIAGPGLQNESDGTAASVVETDRGGDPSVSDFRTYATGVGGTVDGTAVLVGHPRLFADREWSVPDRIATVAAAERDAGRVPVLVGRDGRAAGHVVVGDEQRDGWSAVVDGLADRGIDVAVLTGDDDRTAATYRDHPAIDAVFAGVPPEGKAETVRRYGAGRRTAMVGDGTNDAPALATADLGIALGSGTAIAADAADVAIVDDDLASVETAFDLAASAGRRVRQNIGWAFCYNGIAIPVAMAGLLNPLVAALAMATSSLLVVTNSARSLLD